MSSELDASEVAKKLDFGICSTFGMIPYVAWTAWALEYTEVAIDAFMDEVCNFRNEVSLRLRELGQSDWKWQLLEDASSCPIE
jgi:hypothetical protein